MITFHKYHNQNGAKTFGAEFWWNSERFGLSLDFWTWTFMALKENW